MNKLAGFFKGAAYLFVGMVAIQGTVLVLRQGYIDYGWLGVVVVLALGIPFFWLVPLLGWWFLPTAQMLWLVLFIGLFLLSTWGASWCENRAKLKEPD